MEQHDVIVNSETEGGKSLHELKQLCGFKINNDYYAISVLEVQEVIRPLNITKVPLSVESVKGLINLRGQIVTSISLKKLFNIEDDERDEYMNIIVRSGDSLYALIVDEISDVLNIDETTFEPAPDTLDGSIRNYIRGVYKLDGKLLIHLDLEKIIGQEKESA
jgi:purine-binding chemotaxis protein CheW